MPVNHISNGIIQDIFSERNNLLVTVAYGRSSGNRRNEQTVRLVITPRTAVLNRNGVPVPASALRVGMTIDAAFSSAMTRSIPPQATALFIRIVENPQPGNRPDNRPTDITTGRIVDIARDNRSFTTVSGLDFSTVIRFNVSENTRFFDRMGRPVRFSSLTPGMRVQVRHANFMTASIPPQTTAFEVRIL